MAKQPVGDISAGELLQIYSPMIYRIAYSAVQNRADAEDITQNVFLKYITANKSFNDEEHRKAWLIRVAVNCSKDLVKSAYYKRRSCPESLPDTGQTDVYFKEEKSENLKKALQQLPEKYRVPIHLFYYEEMSVSQISRVTGIKEPTIKSQLSRGREMLKNILKEEDYEL